MKTKVMNRNTLIELNNDAIRRKANMVFEPTRLAALDPDVIAVVQTSLLHNDREIRAEIRVGPGPHDTALLDMTIENFNRLPYFEDGKFYQPNGIIIE